MSLGVCFIKKIALVKVGAFAWYSVKIHVIFGVRFETQKVDKKKQAYTKTETCKLYSGVFWIFLPNVIKNSKSIVIILSYTVSKLARFLETQWLKIWYLFRPRGFTVYS